MKTIAILLFHDVEVLDACGPFEVFATAKDIEGAALYHVITVAESTALVRAVGGLLLKPHYDFEHCPPIDVLLVPGGVGRKREIDNAHLIAWIRDRAMKAELVVSVCTGAFLLAQASLLDGLAATTHHSTLDEMTDRFPKVTVRRNVRYVDSGRVVTAAGIAAGIDASLYILARLAGAAIATSTAERMEYPLPAGIQ